MYELSRTRSPIRSSTKHLSQPGAHPYHQHILRLLNTNVDRKRKILPRFCVFFVTSIYYLSCLAALIRYVNAPALVYNFVIK